MVRKNINKCILVISDLHAPYMHRDAPAFLKAIKKKYNPDRVISTGDEIDWHSISFHTKNPSLPNPSKELELAIKQLQSLYKLFPKMDIFESNHGSLVFRKAMDAGLPEEVLRSYREILKAPKGWNWHFELTLKMSNGQELYGHHSKGANVLKNSQAMGMCMVQGHHHEAFEIAYWGNPNALLWGMTVGCLADPKSLALAYAKNNLKRPVLGVGLIVDGLPQLIPMVLDKRGRWVGKL